MEAIHSNLRPTHFLTSNQITPHEDREHGRHSQHAVKSDTVFISQQARTAYSEQLAQQSSVEIITREGDKVTITMTATSNYQSRLSYSDTQSQAGRNTAFSAYQSKQSSMQYHLSIEGNIDNDEREAIQNLVQNIDKLASDLYQGDIQSAYRQAVSLEYDTDELQSYSFNVTQTKARQYTAAYEEVAKIQTKKPSNSAPANDLSAFIESLKDSIEDDINSINKHFQTGSLQSLIKQTADFFERESLSWLKPAHHLSDLLEQLSASNIEE